LPMQLLVYEGMPVYHTKNTKKGKHLKLANGTFGHIAKIQFPPHVTFEESSFGVQIPSHPPDVIYIKTNSDKVMDERCPPGIVPVRPITERVNFKKATSRNFSLYATQFPLIAGFALTCEKVQGLTMDKIILTNLRGYRRACPRSSLYVALSRVRKLSDLYLTEPLTMEDLHYFRPTQSLIHELERLERLAIMSS